MRKVILSLAAAGAALAVASPAAAQFYPGQQGYGYGYNQYNAQRTHEIGRRIEQLNRQIQGLGRAGALDPRQQRSLALESRALGYQLQSVSRNGMNPREQSSIEARLANLEQRLQFAAGNRNGYRNNGYNGYNGSNGGYYNDRNRGGDRYDRNRDDGNRDRDDD